MGANHSHSAANGRRHGDVVASLKTAGMSDYILSPSNKAASPHGKPSPPSQAQATDVTNSSVTLSWQLPRHNSGNTVFAYTVELSYPKDPKAWTVVTKCCQGNSYQVKHLQPNTQYLFRVRAENIHGVSKGSRPSEVVETKMYEVDQQLYHPAPENKPRQVPRRRHSINLHLEGTVTSILNHTDFEVPTTSCREGRVTAGSDTESGASSPLSCSQEMEKDDSRTNSLQREKDGSRTNSLRRDSSSRINIMQRDAVLKGNSLQREAGSRTNSLQREAALRNSWQPSRKRSLPILLPGTRTLSLHKLRDSHTFPTTRARSDQATDSLKRREQRWSRERPVSDTPSSSSDSKEDSGDCKSCSSREDSTTTTTTTTTDDDLKSDRVDGQTIPEEPDQSANPWEKDDSVNQVSDRILSAPLCDDIKMALYARSVSDCCSTWTGRGVLATGSPTEGGQTNFRTLRSLLHSDDIIVKPTRSLPDMGVVGVGSKKTPISNTLSTIVDLEEEDESVRITTL